MDEYRDTLVLKSALRLAPMLMLRPGELRQAECDHLELDAAEWRSTVSKTKSEHIVPSDGSGRNTGEVHPSVRVRGLRTHLGCHAGIIKGARGLPTVVTTGRYPTRFGSMRPVHQLAEDRPPVHGALLRR